MRYLVNKPRPVIWGYRQDFYKNIVVTVMVHLSFV